MILTSTYKFSTSIFFLLVFLTNLRTASAQNNPSNSFLIKIEASKQAVVKSKLTKLGFEAPQSIFKKPLIWKIVKNQVKNSDQPTVNINEILNIAGIISAQPDRLAESRSTFPDDPDFPSQWHLNQIKAPEAWDLNTGGLTSDGQQPVVAIIDAQFDTNHEDLINNIWFNKAEIPNDGIDNDNNGYIDDYFGINLYSNNDQHEYISNSHGTTVMGVAGASGNNGAGISGVLWSPNIMVLSKSRGGLLESDFIKAYDYALDQRKKYNESNKTEGAFVVAVSVSLGFSNSNPADFPLWCEVLNAIGTEGIIGVSATVNQQVDVDIVGDIPTTCLSPYQISVTASTNTDNLWTGSAYGFNSIDIAAPGVDIVSTKPGNKYGISGSGTSLATPQVAASLSLMYSAANGKLLDLITINPAAGALIMRNLLLNSVDKIPSMEGKINSGGRLNLFKSLQSASTYQQEILPEALIIEMIQSIGGTQMSVSYSTNNIEPINVTLFDAQGKTLITNNSVQVFNLGQNTMRIDYRNINSGLLILQLEQGGQIARQKFVHINY